MIRADEFLAIPLARMLRPRGSPGRNWVHDDGRSFPPRAGRSYIRSVDAALCRIRAEHEKD